MELILAVLLLFGLYISLSFFLEFKKSKDYKKQCKVQSIEIDFANKKIEYLREELSKAESENSELIKGSWRFTKNDKVVFKSGSLSIGYDFSVDEHKPLIVVQYTCEDIVLVYDGSDLHQVRECDLEYFNPRENMEIIDVVYSYEQPIGENAEIDNLRTFVHELYKKGLLDIESGIITKTGNEEVVYKISAIKVKP